MRLKRTQMSAAAYKTDRIEEVLATDTDMIMLDLEDNVIPPLKAKARETLVRVLKQFDFHGVIKCVKINGWESGMTILDLEAVLPAGVDEIKLSKCENPEDVRRLDIVITDFERRNAVKPGTVEINVQIESPLGIRNAYEIFRASPRVKTASFGHEDLANSLGVERDYSPGTQQPLYMMGKFILDANAARVRQINGTAVVARAGEFQGEDDYVRSDTLNLRTIGFTSRGTMYSRHIGIINEIFTPDAKELTAARELLKRWRRGNDTGDASLFVMDNGLPIDPGRVERAERLVEIGDAYEELLRRKSGQKEVNA